MWMQRFESEFCQLWVELCKLWGDECIFMFISDVFINPPAREPHIWDPLYKSPVHLYMCTVLRLHKYYRRFSMLASREFCRSFPASSVKKVNLHVEKPAGSDRQTQVRLHLFLSALWFYFSQIDIISNSTWQNCLISCHSPLSGEGLLWCWCYPI